MVCEALFSKELYKVNNTSNSERQCGVMDGEPTLESG